MVVAAGLAQPASAALLSISGGSSEVIPTVNNVVGPAGVGTPGTSQYIVGGALSTTANSVTLTYYDLGSESGWTTQLVTQNLSDNDDFDVGSGVNLPLPGELIGSELQVNAGLVKLDFNCVAGQCGTPKPVGLVSNQGLFPPTNGASIAFAYLDPASFQIVAQATDVVLFLLDDGGAGPDDNHDDYAGIVVATPVPAALPLFLTALGGAGLLGRRRQRRTA
jgi:hypothetical protein